MSTVESRASPRAACEPRACPDGPGFRASIGDLHVLGTAWPTDLPLLGIFASVHVPPDLVLPAFDLARALRARGITSIGGFQSAVEREYLAILLRGDQPIVICPARGLEGLRIPERWRGALRLGRLSLVSPFGAAPRRSTSRSATVRNRLVVTLADRLLVIHASPGSRAFAAARQALDAGKRVFCLDHERNRDLLLMGAEKVGVADVGEVGL